jgi:N12 class adenine-specific DNA methylase
MHSKLWIDDIRTPLDDSYDIARTYDEAIQMLSKYDYVEVHLDHDLADFDESGNERNGSTIVRWLADRKHIDKLYVPTHYYMLTDNPEGRRYMCGVIERYLDPVVLRLWKE